MYMSSSWSSTKKAARIEGTTITAFAVNAAVKAAEERIEQRLLGRLAVERRCKGEGLGRVLLYDAIERVRSAPAGCYAMIVDAKDKGAKDFYVSFGFDPLKDSPMRLFFVL